MDFSSKIDIPAPIAVVYLVVFILCLSFGLDAYYNGRLLLGIPNDNAEYTQNKRDLIYHLTIAFVGLIIASFILLYYPESTTDKIIKKDIGIYIVVGIHLATIALFGAIIGLTTNGQDLVEIQNNPPPPPPPPPTTIPPPPTTTPPPPTTTPPPPTPAAATKTTPARKPEGKPEEKPKEK